MEGRKVELVVPQNKDKERLDVFLTYEVAGVSRSQVQRLIKL